MLTNKGTAILTIGNAYAQLKDAGRQIDAEHRLIKEQRLKDIGVEFDRLVLRAKQEGASISAICEAMGTKNRHRVYESLQRAEEFSPALKDFDPMGDRYTLNDDNTVTVTLTTDEVLWEQDNYMDVKNRNVPHNGTFEKHPVGGWRYKKQDGDPTFQIEGHVNPLTYWSRRAENIRELTEWAEGKGL